MFKVEMYYTIKTLLDQGKSLRAISLELNMDRKTVRRIQRSISAGKKGPDAAVRVKKLGGYEEEIKALYERGLTGVLIHRELITKGLEMSYPTVARSLERLKAKEVFVPIHTPPGEQAQVDFGYLGKFNRHGTQVKVWVFCMILSYSRHAFYTLVTNQKVATFLRCHIKAFDYFGGAPRTIKPDNLASGVTTPDLYEPMIQEQYAAFLAHYTVAVLPSPVRRPQDKGKVEAGVKYVKGNFLRALKTNDYDEAAKELYQWNEEIASLRVHGTTRKVPKEVFQHVEKTTLQTLPAQHFQLYEVTSRKVSRYGHLTFNHCYYSVPFRWAGETLRLESNGNLIRVFKDQELICIHQISLAPGEFITRQEHLPDGKQTKNDEYYLQHVASIGGSALAWIQAVKKHTPYYWRNMARGLMNLKRTYSPTAINLSCKRALEYGEFRYQKVKSILEKNLWKEHIQSSTATYQSASGGFAHDLSFYDVITTKHRNGTN